MGFIQEAQMMLDAAEKASSSQPLRVGYLTLAKDTISAALTEAKKGVKAQDGHVVPGQTSLEEFTGPTAGPAAIFDDTGRGAVVEVTVDGSGMVLTPADTAVELDEEGDLARGIDILADLPTEADYDAALERHKGHLADLDAGIYAEDCVYCQAIAMTRQPQHDRPDTSEDIPRINDSRPIPDGQGAQ